MDTPAYAELHCLSNFTFLRGASHPEELVARAAELGYTALAVTDEGSLAGVVRAHVAAKEHGLRLLTGSELRLADGPLLVALAMDRNGYGNLSALLTRGRRRAAKGAYELRQSDLADGLPGCLLLWVPTETEEDSEMGRWLAATFPDRAWLAVELHRGPDDAARCEALLRLAEATGLPAVAAGDVHMHTRRRKPLQDLLTAIRLGTTVQAAGHALHPNGERHLRPRRRLARVYPPGLLAETLRIAERCTFSLDELRYEYPDDDIPPGETGAAYLRRLTYAGMTEHWPEGAPERVVRLVEHELSVIAELGYEPYFLTVWDIVRFARGRGILCQGRGSAANSAVCFCLGITAVDPARMEMLFERFVSKERGEPPDIDVDFEHERREEVIQYLYAKYGRDRAALAATVISYRPKSALRDAAKALGLDPVQADRLAEAHGHWRPRLGARSGGAGTAAASTSPHPGEPSGPGILDPERLREAGFDPDHPWLQRLLELVAQLLGFPRHLSQHVGGFVIARDDLQRLVPIENAAMAERSVIQWDKDDLEAMGLMKVDVLGLGMLSAIRRAFDLIEARTGKRPALATIPPEDPAVYRMIRRAETLGVFQIESRAQMAMLPRLRPETFYDLVVEISIVRPGPIQGEMVPPYLRRRQGTEPVTYPSAEVRAVLERTLGVPIFQEQVIKLAMVAAGFSAGEAERLRRAMAAWKKRGGLEPFERRLHEGMAERGYSNEFARRIFEQIRGFAEYGFPESHAASFAHLVYVSAWLKRHEPAAFFCALLNSQPMGFYAPAQIVHEARRHGVEVRPVDARVSEWDCTLEGRADSGISPRGRCPTVTKGAHEDRPADDPALPRPALPRPALRLGLRQVKGLSRTGAERLATARIESPFHEVTELAVRAGLNRGDLEALAAAGALQGLAGHRHHARWAVLGVEPGTLPLFPEETPEPDPGLRAPAEGEDIVADYRHLGLTLGRHPLALLRPQLKALRLAPTRTGRARDHGRRLYTAGIVVTRQRPSTAGGVLFLTLEDETGTVNVIVWPRVAEAQYRTLVGARLLGVDGEVQRGDGGVIHLVARRLVDLSPLLGELPTRSRDFH